MQSYELVILVLVDIGIEVILDDAFLLSIVHTLHQGCVIFVELLNSLLVFVLLLGD